MMNLQGTARVLSLSHRPFLKSPLQLNRIVPRNLGRHLVPTSILSFAWRALTHLLHVINSMKMMHRRHLLFHVYDLRVASVPVRRGVEKQ